MRRALALLTVAALAAGCSSREHLNPLDPANARTGGAPQGFAALAADHAVELVWQPPPSGLVADFRLYRGVGDAAPALYAELPGVATRFVDSGLANGVTVTYRLAYVTGAGESTPATDVATPGAAEAWIADPGAARIHRLTADGRRVAETIAQRFRLPAAIDVSDEGYVWVADTDGGRLWRATPGEVTPEEVGAFVSPVAVRVDRARRRVWVADNALQVLRSYDPSNIVSPLSETPVSDPVDVAVDPIDGSVWVCDYASDRVRRFGPGGGAGGAATVIDPSRAAVDSATRRVWVTSSRQHRVVVFELNGTPADTITAAAGPDAIAIDGARGYVWVCDEATDSVFGLDRAGAVRFRVGVPAPYGIAIDPSTGDAWVALATGQVERLAADTGRVLTRLSGFVAPVAIALRTQ